jgi:hypothetical protein
MSYSICSCAKSDQVPGRHLGVEAAEGESCDALTRCDLKSCQDLGKVIAHQDYEAVRAFNHGQDRD